MNQTEELSSRIRELLDPKITLLRLELPHVIVSVQAGLPTPQRGKLLLDTERQLRNELDRELEVFLEPMGDLSKLRQQLRGISLDGSREDIFADRYDSPQDNDSQSG